MGYAKPTRTGRWWRGQCHNFGFSSGVTVVMVKIGKGMSYRSVTLNNSVLEATFPKSYLTSNEWFCFKKEKQKISAICYLGHCMSDTHAYILCHRMMPLTRQWGCYYGVLSFRWLETENLAYIETALSEDYLSPSGHPKRGFCFPAVCLNPQRPGSFQPVAAV